MNLKSFENSLIGGVHTFIRKKPCSIIFEHTLNVIRGHTLNVILGHTLNVILGLVPRIHAEHTLMDTRVKPEYDYKVMQCGRSMIEMLGVLAIIGVLSVGGIAGYSKAMMKFKINKTAQQITEIVTNIRTLYMHQDDFNGLNSITAIQMGAVPDDLDIDTSRGEWSAVKNAFGGRIYIAGSIYDNDKSFIIDLNGLPKEACVALATADWGTTSSSGFVGMFITDYSMGAGIVVDGCDSEGEVSGCYYACSGHLPLAPSLAAKYCSGSILFAFK